MSLPKYLVAVNPSVVAGGPLQETLVLTSDITGGGSSTVTVNGTLVTSPNFQDDSSITWALSGSNVHATTIGLATDSGVISINSNHPTHQGQLLISQPGNTSALWADPFVQGPWINGTAVVSPGAMGDGTSNIQPVWVAGYDGTNMRGILTDSSGRQIVNVNGSVTVTGTVAATQSGTWNIGTVTSITNAVTVTGTVSVTQSTSPWTVAGSLSQNSQTGSTYTAYQATLVAQANTSNPSWTDGKLVPLSVDASGNLRVNTAAGGSVQYSDGSTVPTPTGTVAMGKNASNIVHALSLDGSGNLNVNTQASTFAAAPGAALPASTAWIGASDGTDIQGLLVESSSNKNLRVSIFQGGNEANVTSNRLLVDPSGTTMAVTQSTSPWVTSDTNIVAQGSTTSGQKGPLVQGAVTTNAPSYTNNQTDPLSLTTSGYLRTNDFAASVSANGSTAVPTNAMFVGFKGADGFLHAAKSSTNDGALDVNASFSGTVTPGFVADRQVSGAISALNGVVNASTQGASMVTIRISGTWSATLTFQLSTEDGVYTTATAFPAFTGGASVTSTTTNGVWMIPVGGASNVQVQATSFSSNTSMNIAIEVGAGNQLVYVAQPTAGNLNMTAVQGTAGTQAQAWFVKVTDGSNPLGTSSNPWIIAGTKTNNNAAPGSNNVGVLPALANSSAPSYTDGDQVLLSVDTTGALRVSSSGTFTPALTADITSTGTITSSQSVTLSTQGTGTTLFNVTGSWTGTLVFEASVDGVNFVSAKATAKYPLTLPSVNSTTTNGQWAIATGGLNKFRVRGNTVTSGTATVWIEGGAGAQDIAVFSVIVDPASGNTPAVKASSTVPVATDQSLVVSLSPNSAQFATSTTANALPGVNPVSVGGSSVAILTSNANRKEAIVINTGTTVIFLGLGQTPTTTAYHIALAACSTANDGTGGSWTTDMWKGTINAIGSAGGGTVVVTELT